VIPRGARIGRNVKVAADIRSTDFVKKVIRSGESVEPKPGVRRAHDHGPFGHEHVAAVIGGARGKGARGKGD
jgi:hypothetical protein